MVCDFVTVGDESTVSAPLHQCATFIIALAACEGLIGSLCWEAKMGGEGEGSKRKMRRKGLRVWVVSCQM